MSAIAAEKHRFDKSSVRQGRRGRGLGKNNNAYAAVGFRPLRFEPMEERALLSVDLQFHHIVYDPSASASSVSPIGPVAPQDSVPLSSPSPVGFTPQQIRTAYGIDSIMLGTVQGTGLGQTIAIIDAYDAPNFVNSTDPNFVNSDLYKFDHNPSINLPDPPSFQKLDEYGGTSYPAASGSTGWSVETSLDVEWAHAMAPQANIILVEANGTSDADLVTTAVNTARNLPGVTAISMSFGRSESSSDSSVASVFSTPAGHAGVTFLASTGDDGSPGGFPAYSPNVVAVGGTTLTINATTSAWVSETGWSGSGGGQSGYEAKPSYQNGVNTSSWRQIPDISFDADPASGVAVMDTYDYGSSSPWVSIGGTSVSSPCWAGLIAVADQLRSSVGLGTMNGLTDTLPLLYSMKAADFHDIVSGSNGGFSAHTGYDEVTGIGSPIANKLIPDFVPVAPKGTVAFSTHAYEIGTSATITLSDLDLVASPSYSVTLTSSAGDSETVSLPAQGGGIFRGSILTAAGAVVSGDAILQTLPGGTITVTYNDANDGTGHSATVTDQATTFQVDHYAFSTISSPETAGVGFSVTVSAYDSSNALISGYNGTATLSAAGHGGALSIGPTSVTFVSGVWTGNVAVNAVDPTVTLHVANAAGAAGTSSTFATQAGPVASFQYSTIPSPEYQNVAFPVTLTAKDANGYTATGFSGTANLTGLVGTTTSQTILGQPASTNSGNNGSYTVGYSFTPSGDFLVKDILHYFGTKLSIWTAAGVLLTSQTYSGTGGSWLDTPMTTPYLLHAGTTYVITVYTAGQTYYWKNETPPSSPVGAIGNDYEVSGDAFPTSVDNPQQWLVDLRGDFGTNGPVSISPTTAAFTAGVWTGNVTVTQAASGMHLHVDDGAGHVSDSNTFTVNALPSVTPTFPANATEGDGVLKRHADHPDGFGQRPRGEPDVERHESSHGARHRDDPRWPDSAPLPVTIIDNALLDGPEAVVVTTTATGYSPANATITVHDNETAVLTVGLPATALEGAGVLHGAGTITASAAPSRDIVVQLTSTNTTEVAVPATVTLPAGQTTVSFDVTIGDDWIVDGTQTAVVSAHVENWTDGSATINVYNTDVMALNGEWHTLGNGPSHTGYFPGILGDTPLTSLLWSVSNVGANQVAIGGGDVYVSRGRQRIDGLE